jgi:hypothetical protein
MHCVRRACRIERRASTCLKAVRMSALGVRRGKAAFFSGCKSHPAIAPARSNRSSRGGAEMAEAFGIACHELVSPDFRCGSNSEVSGGHENVCSWVTSGRNPHDNGHPNDARFPCLLFDQ